MLNKNQVLKLQSKLIEYSKFASKKTLSGLNESDTRLKLINNFLTNVLGYSLTDDISTETEARGEYADYVIKIGRKNDVLIEAKAITVELNDNHMIQVLNYAGKLGVNWCVVTNGRQINFYKFLFKKPIDAKLIFKLDLFDKKNTLGNAYKLQYLTRKAIETKAIDQYVLKCSSLENDKIKKIMLETEVVNLIKRKLINSSGLKIEYGEVESVINNLLKKL